MSRPPRPRRAGPPGRLPAEVRVALVGILVARTAVNGGIRVVYPFLPEIARGLGVSLGVVAGLVAMRSAVGVLAPLAARVTEVVGQRALMIAAVCAALAGSATIGLAPTAAVAGIGFVGVGLAKPAFDVSMQSWLGARVPYERRGRAFGTTELTWAAGLLVTVPLSGFLIARTSWRAQFVVVVAICAAGVVALARLIASDRPQRRQPRPLRVTRTHRLVLAGVLLFSLASELLAVVYGAWLETSLGLDVAAIGLFTLVVVAAEAAGEAGVAAVGDRVGLRRGVLTGLVVSTGAYLAIGFVGGSLVAAIGVVVVWFVAYEVTIVSAVPLISELSTAGRARLLSLAAGTVALARALGAVMAPPVYALGGIGATGALAAACTATAALLFLTVPAPSRSGA